MRDFRYLPGTATLALDRARCVGCGMCVTVCPQGALAMEEGEGGKAVIADLDGCMECGACATNCPAKAVTVRPGVGCASYIIQVWLKGRDKASCGPDCC